MTQLAYFNITTNLQCKIILGKDLQLGSRWWGVRLSCGLKVLYLSISCKLKYVLYCE